MTSIATRRRRRRHPALSWLELGAEAAIIASVASYVAGGWLWALLLWELITAGYLALGLALSWSGGVSDLGDSESVEFLSRWSWLLPVVASAAGVSAAVTALSARSSVDEGRYAAVLAAAASLGIVLSWALLQVGFANMYELLDATAPEADRISFPGNGRSATMDYLYFAFVIGTSFATSDADIRTVRVRRAVLAHSVVSFFYNALVVAVAFQVLQQLVTAG